MVYVLFHSFINNYISNKNVTQDDDKIVFYV